MTQNVGKTGPKKGPPQFVPGTIVLTIGMCRRTIVKTYKPPTIKAKLLNLLRGRGQMGAKCGPWRPKQGFDLSCGGFVGLYYDPPTHSNGQN